MLHRWLSARDVVSICLLAKSNTTDIRRIFAGFTLKLVGKQIIAVKADFQRSRIEFLLF
jgi:hypothetical protein